MKKRNKSLFTSVTALALAAVSAGVYAENLTQVYELALQNDPQFKAAQATRDAAYESVKITRGEFLPNINANASYSDSSTTSDTTPGSTVGTSTTTVDGATTSYGVSLIQPLYKSYTNASHSINKNYVKQADADYQSAEQNLIIRVATQYFAVLGAQDNLEFSKAELNANTRQLEQTKQRFEVGLVAITDVHEAQARHDLSVSQMISAENLLNNELESLRAITGKYHESLAVLREETPLTPPEPNDIEHWTKLAFDQNPLLLSSQYLVEQARGGVDLQRSGYKPTLDFRANYNHSDSDNYGESHSTTYSINFGMNLFAGGSTSAYVRQAEYNLTRALETLEEARRTTQRNARNAFLGVSSAVSQVKALKQAVISSESRLKASEAGFDVGTRTTVDVLDARRELFNSQRQYARSRYDYILQKLQLEQSSGGLNIDDINMVNSWLQ